MRLRRKICPLIVGAMFLFQEFLTIERVFGAAMVLGGILLMQWTDARARKSAVN